MSIIISKRFERHCAFIQSLVAHSNMSSAESTNNRRNCETFDVVCVCVCLNNALGTSTTITTIKILPEHYRINVFQLIVHNNGHGTVGQWEFGTDKTQNHSFFIHSFSASVALGLFRDRACVSVFFCLLVFKFPSFYETMCVC